jgi:lysine-specific demethylase/histidyl-hydroxylase NO66
MAKQGKVIAPRAYTRSGGLGAGIADQVADDRVLELVADGATLVLQALHRSWPPLIDFGSALAAELGHPVQINAYLTPPENQGFAPHYDTHDVFVLQVAGTKRWVIHAPVFADPLPGQDWEQHRDAVQQRAATPPLLDVVLAPGDALYLPRGFVHSAMAQGETSLHLTVGAHPVTRYSLLKHLLSAAAEQHSLRASLPMGVDLAVEEVLAEHLRDTVSAFTEFAGESQLPALADRLAAELMSATRPVPVPPLAQLAVLNSLSATDWLRLRPGLRVRVEPVAAGFELRFLDRRISVAAQAEPALKAVLSGDPVQAGALAGLDAAAALELARRLVAAAVLVPAVSA